MAKKFHAAYIGPKSNLFLYDTSAVSQDLATRAYIQECSVGQLVGLVLAVLSIESKWTGSSISSSSELFQYQ